MRDATGKSGLLNEFDKFLVSGLTTSYTFLRYQQKVLFNCYVLHYYLLLYCYQN